MSWHGQSPTRRRGGLLGDAEGAIDERAEQLSGAGGGAVRLVAGSRDVADRLEEPRGGEDDDRHALRGHEGEHPPGAVVAEQHADDGVLAGGAEEELERGADRRAGVVEVLADGGVDVVEEALADVDDEGLGELVAAAELLVEGLAADAGRARHVGHRYLRPCPSFELVAHRPEERLAQQIASRLRVRRAGSVRRLGGGGGPAHPSPPSPTGSKSTLSRTPQSGQAQSSGTSLHGVPGGKPSRGWPASSS